MNEAFTAKPYSSYRMIWHRNVSAVSLNEIGNLPPTSKFKSSKTNFILRFNPVKAASVERVEIDWLMSIFDEVKAEIETIEGA